MLWRYNILTIKIQGKLREFLFNFFQDIRQDQKFSKNSRILHDLLSLKQDMIQGCTTMCYGDIICLLLKNRRK